MLAIASPIAPAPAQRTAADDLAIYLNELAPKATRTRTRPGDGDH